MQPGIRPGREKRWFVLMLVSSVGGTLSFLAMAGVQFWATREVSLLFSKFKPGELVTYDLEDLFRRVRITVWTLRGATAICCLLFLLAGTKWFIAVRQRRAGKG